jgi:predicted nucleic acid-binding protein
MASKRSKIVVDTNVFVAAARSRKGASWQIVRAILLGEFDLVLSVAVALEYEAVLKRESDRTGMSVTEAEDFVSFLCANATRHEPYGRFWPLSNDPDDERFARLVASSDCDAFITHNVRHFSSLADAGLSVMTPGAFLRRLRNQP